MAVTWAEPWQSPQAKAHRSANGGPQRSGRKEVQQAVGTSKAKAPNLVLREIREKQRRESREEFAAAIVKTGRQLGDKQLGCDARQIARWEDGDTDCPRPAYQRALEALTGRPFDQLGFRPRGESAVSAPAKPNQLPTADIDSADGSTAIAGQRLTTDPAIGAALEWLDQHANWPAGAARRRVRMALGRLDASALEDLRQQRGSVSREQIARALASYYKPAAPYGFYTARHADHAITTSVLTRPEWIDLALPLGCGLDSLKFDPTPQSFHTALPALAVSAAARRLAEIVISAAKMVNARLYRLRYVDVSDHGLSGSVGLARFADYALTLDLLEGELVDAIASGAVIAPELLPLRGHYLADMETLLGFASRLCVGGPLALLAIARDGQGRAARQPDYILLVQERSATVLNSARRLAVIPKAFHEPLVDLAADAQILATIEREMEEELFGRAEVDSTLGGPRQADPMHLTRLTPPMRWLAEHPEAWRTECTAFGVNAVSGNYELASVIVIDDPCWWDEYGGLIQANWESEGLLRYSSLDHDQLAALIHDPAWSNEGVFAFCQALRRLRQTGEDRVNLPKIDLEETSG